MKTLNLKIVLAVALFGCLACSKKNETTVPVASPKSTGHLYVTIKCAKNYKFYSDLWVYLYPATGGGKALAAKSGKNGDKVDIGELNPANYKLEGWVQYQDSIYGQDYTGGPWSWHHTDKTIEDNRTIQIQANNDLNVVLDNWH